MFFRNLWGRLGELHKIKNHKALLAIGLCIYFAETEAPQLIKLVNSFKPLKFVITSIKSTILSN